MHLTLARKGKRGYYYMIGVSKTGAHTFLIGEGALQDCQLETSSRVLVAFSGGADSTALLLELVQLWREGRLQAVAAAHFHHGIRGEEAEEDLSFCRELAERLEIPFFSGRGDVPAYAKAQELSLESAARVLRYAFLESTAREWGATAIATGHHREDQAETVLLHLLRGSGMKGLCGMEYRHGDIVRPLLEVSRREILAYLEDAQQPYRTDSTNLEDDADRNRIRHRVLPVMEEINPRAAAHLAHTAGLLQEEEQFLEGLAREADKRCKGSRELLAKEPPVLQKRVLKAFLRQYTWNYTGEDIDRLQSLLVGQSGREATLSGGLVFRAEGDRLMKAEEKGTYRVPISPGQPAVTPYGVITMEEVAVGKIPCGREEAYISGDALVGELCIRPYEAGEGFTPLGMKGRKLFSDYFTDKKVPLSQRQSPIVFDEAGVVYAAGYTIDDRVRIGEGTGRIYHFQYFREV